MNNKYRHVLNMTEKHRNDSVISLLKHETASLGVRYAFTFFGTDNEKHFGVTSHDRQTHRANVIAINSDLDNEDRLTDTSFFGKENVYVSDFDFLSHINAVYHERSHCRQSQNLWDEQSKHGRDLTLSFLSDTHIEDIHASDKYRLPSDVFAEIYALPGTYHYLQDNFYNPILMPHETLDSVFLSFVNELCYRNEYYCLNTMEPDKTKRKQYHSIDDLFNDIDLKNPDSVYYKILNEPPIEKYELIGLDEKENRVFRFAESMEDRTVIAGYAVCLNNPELQQYFGSLKSLNLNDEVKNLETKYRNMPEIEQEYTYESGDDEYE